MSYISRIIIRTLSLSLLVLAPMDQLGLNGLCASPAQAQEASSANLQLVPPGDVVGDGATPVHLRFIGLNSEGGPATGLSARVAFSEGTSDRLSESSDGLYELSWTPPEVEEVSQTTLTMKIKVPGGNSGFLL